MESMEIISGRTPSDPREAALIANPPRREYRLASAFHRGAHENFCPATLSLNPNPVQAIGNVKETPRVGR